MFGGSPPPQSETTPFYPRSPYGAAKVYAYWIARELPRGVRDARLQRDPLQPRVPAPRRDLRHPQDHARRGRIKLGLQKKLYLGNLDAKRDWGYAGDYVEAMWLMLQQPKADDYVIATGETHSVRELCEVAFGHVGLDYQDFVEVDPRYFRPTEVDYLLGDPSKAVKQLGWKIRTGFKELVKIMMDADVELAAREQRAGAGPAVSRHG